MTGTVAFMGSLAIANFLYARVFGHTWSWALDTTVAQAWAVGWYVLSRELNQ